MSNWSQKEIRLDSILDYAKENKKSSSGAGFIEFVNDFYKNASPEDLSLRLDELYAIALSNWKFISDFTQSKSKIRIFNPTLEEHGWTSSHTIIQILSRDMPFLIDSITSNLLEDGNMLHMLMHPVLVHNRDKNGKIVSKGGEKVTESVMHIEITAMSDQAEINELSDRLKLVTAFVLASVEDWRPILSKVEETSKNLDLAPKSVSRDEVKEAQSFLKWLTENNFTLLGYREYNHNNKKSPTGDEGFGILRDPDVQVLRGPEGLVAISPEIEDFMADDKIMLITKANVKSLVHRVVHLDYVGFKKFDKKGKVISETRFVGLFTSDSYNQRAQNIPFLDRKVRSVVERSGFDYNSHDGKALFHILETLPRDELFQIEEEPLFQTSIGILHLNLRPQCRAFIRKDKFERFVSALVFVPKDLYNSILRTKIEKILCDAFNGELSSRYAQLSNDRIARWHFIIRTKPGQVPNPDTESINKRISKVAQSWTDYFLEVLEDRHGEEKATQLYRKYSKSFTSAYQENFDPRFAVTDVDKLEQLPVSNNIGFNFYRDQQDPDHVVRLKLYTSQETIALSDCLPMLENMGLRVIEEYAFEVVTEDHDEKITHSIHDFYLEDPSLKPFDLGDLKSRMEDGLNAVWANKIDNDGFNKLVLKAGLTYHHALILRIYSKYLRQLGSAYSEIYMQDTLTQYVDVSKLLAELFEIKFNLGDVEGKSRKADAKKHIKKIKKLLADVESLDQDRMLRNYLNVITCSLRTNFYQTDDSGIAKPYISIKIKSQDVDEAPKPRPHAEIFVYSPRFEGVHLRSGPVARGGLRWSDRKEDYRTEILGLVKAQQVKNTVIVPVGAKGGFVPKQMPPNPSREEFLEEGIACYKSFISGLLDITDNLKEDKVIPPKDVVRVDGDDPYLVVAADKGTATFSDIANGLAQDYGFWLDDAFASGGSVGYDHKKMGITARGAWVSVQRHFREQGINVQKDSITIAGIGDMSGDVFGNGLLCSEVVKLVAAFDHRDIFIDPEPDPAKSYAERKRIFDLPRSSWEDYNKKLLSNGGGIFSRRLKSIDLSPEMKSLFSFDDDVNTATPNELIRAILKSHVDLLWFGGIGTYVKAGGENSAEVGDRANDAIRINGKELNCKVIGEGGNLGCTQLGRIEYCLNGGMMNTDAVDNSAGVDCSDNEVNIKILLNSIVADGKMTQKQRDTLLEAMTDDVADLVLRDNYLQSQAISIAKSSSIRQLDSFTRYLDDLEETANLDREMEFLPDDEEMIEREESSLGLTRPENSVLIAYAKMSLFDSLMASDFLDDPYLEKFLFSSFPKRLSEDYKKEMRNHQLRSQIIAKVICNDIVNRGGIQSIKEETGASGAEIARAAIITNEVFELDNLWDQIEKLDHIAPSTIQILMLMDVEEFARRQTIWFLNNTDSKQPVQNIIDNYKPGIVELHNMNTVTEKCSDDSFNTKKNMYTEQSVDEDLAQHIASLDIKTAACDLVQVAKELNVDVTQVATAYFMLGDELGFDWLRSQAEMVETADHWDRLAVNSILGDLQDQQKILTRTTLNGCKDKDCLISAKKWVSDNQSSTLRVRNLLQDFQSSGTINVTKMGFAARQIRNVIVD
ncbi:MAG: NAD-glutamate dehydrogenase [Kordiimonadaceae bacterium]|nr:NAD-glutamate dehydrogenase [Kordiimonadaceae bacterium]MBT6329282.1 NAD-glutamate dehydrogenase [Kordiimonadaceae bacterium]